MKLLPKLPLSVPVKRTLGNGMARGFHHSIAKESETLAVQIGNAIWHLQRGRGHGEDRNSRAVLLLVFSLNKYRRDQPKYRFAHWAGPQQNPLGVLVTVHQ